ncbi:type III-A CRISPR-associated RAMP protein Csm4 [Nitrosomonas sp.]|uniref:type III-A CRISPR-associated RAMP protein Csm4 n=1 Tax=Nitrosomonas sp. TaxID=42353 RepID=UPI0025D55AFE|nr:hypothetical protein [Nitrosomonas sp.]
MTPLHAVLHLRSPLGTPLAGDTLFGQLCHTCREIHGETRLDDLLTGYGNGQPWLVVSDGFPAGFLPRPTVPAALQATEDDPDKRKEAKRRRWIPHATIHQPLPQLLAAAAADEVVYGKQGEPVQAAAFHNTLNRLTGTTGTGEFAPYTQPQIFHVPEQRIDLWLVLDETRFSRTELHTLLETIGSLGYGRDASIGLGKFEVQSLMDAALFQQTHPQANACWILALCAPQGRGFNPERSYWQVKTRFGRHGGALALGDNPFKRPLLLAATGAVLTPQTTQPLPLFTGNGLTGVSTVHEKTVHQGYAPVLPVYIEEFA